MFDQYLNVAVLTSCVILGIAFAVTAFRRRSSILAVLTAAWGLSMLIGVFVISRVQQDNRLLGSMLGVAGGLSWFVVFWKIDAVYSFLRSRFKLH